MANKETRRTQMTKMLLKTALIELMQEKTFRQITIKELCERADLNRTTFYLHYNDQQDVLRDVENELIDKTKEFLDSLNPNSSIIDLIEAFLTYIQDNSIIFRTLLINNQDENFQMEFITSSLRNIENILPEYQNPVTNRYVLTFVLNGAIHIIIEWLESDFDLSKKEIAQLIFKLCDDIYKSI